MYIYREIFILVRNFDNERLYDGSRATKRLTHV